jgi:proteasome lid subunit RPN8/RPN11
VEFRLRYLHTLLYKIRPLLFDERKAMASLPKIVREHTKEIRVLPPPPKEQIIFPRKKPVENFEICITKNSIDKMIMHCRDFAEERLEVMGFLIGDVYKWNDIYITNAKDAVTTDLDATSISVKFARDGFDELFAKLDEIPFEYILVGWYHSHPGLGCFLSETDIDTQRRMFNKPFHIAMVVDPIKGQTRAYKLKDEGYVRRKFVVYIP